MRKQILLTATTVTTSTRELTVWERVLEQKWWMLTKAVVFGLMFLVPAIFFLLAPDSPPPAADAPFAVRLFGWMGQLSDVGFCLVVFAFYLFFMATEILATPQPMLEEDLREKNAAALAKLDADQ